MNYTEQDWLKKAVEITGEPPWFSLYSNGPKVIEACWEKHFRQRLEEPNVHVIPTFNKKYRAWVWVEQGIGRPLADVPETETYLECLCRAVLVTENNKAKSPS